MPVMSARIIHITINRAWWEVYQFASDPTNMPLWAAGLASGLEPDGDEIWIATGPPGTVRVRFSPANDLGVIDHVVTMPDGLEVYNALRVTPNGAGAEVAFTLLQLPGMTNSQFDADAELVQNDLETLRAILESDIGKDTQ